MYCTACGNSNIDTARFCHGCGAPLLKMLKTGATLDRGRYEVLQVLKPGGMSSLYILHDHRLERTCVLKEMVPLSRETHELKEFKEKFRLEALTLSRLSHPRIPRVFDYFEEQDQCYMVMEYIDGDDLLALLSRTGPQGLAEEDVRTWAVSICHILEYLHGQTPVILHRDLKPSNIMIRRGDASLFLVDFGLVKKVQSAFTHRTSWGTEGYAPIEQCQGSPEVRSDLYALGATMHHLLSGNAPMPFKFEPIRMLRPDVTPVMESILEKALQLHAHDRYPSASELGKVLEGSSDRPNSDNTLRTQGSTGSAELPHNTSAHKTVEKKRNLLKALAIIPKHAVPGGMVPVRAIADNSPGIARPGSISAFYLGQFTVTNREFCLFLNECGNRKEGRTKWWKSEIDAYNGIIDRGSSMSPRFLVKPGYEEYPVLYVSWYGAVAYSNWLSERKGLTAFYGGFHDNGERRLDRCGHPGRYGGYRLPTSAEWDSLCRCTPSPGSLYYWGDCSDDRFLWYRNTRSHPSVRRLSDNKELYDMSGKAWEWCHELSGAGRVARGRGWIINPALCLSWNRYDTNPSNRFHFIGFRLARALCGP